MSLVSAIRRCLVSGIRRCFVSSIRRCYIPLAVLALAATFVRPFAPPAAAHAAITPHRYQSMLAARRTRHTILRGYLTDHHPWSDSTLDVYSKAHHTTYHAEMTRSTVVREHGQSITRAALRSGQYVFVTCNSGSGSTCVAIRVTIVIRHARRKH